MTEATAAKPNLMRRLMIAGAFAATFAAGGVAFSVLPAAAAVHGMGMEMGGMHHGGGMHGDISMMKGHIDKMLTEVGASPEQKAKIQSILGDAMGRMHGMHEGMGATHARLHALLTAPTVDRGALEALRAQTVGQMDDASKLMVQALADAAEVLTPAQRAKLGQLMAEHHKG
jgi:Spy/CpxP family protein refolding chaperone